MAVLSGLLMGLTGMGFWGILTGAVFGLLGDLVMKSGSYQSAKKNALRLQRVQPLDGRYIHPDVFYGRATPC